VKTLGIVGGIGPESTVEYYRLLIRLAREAGAARNPSIIINSIDVAAMLELILSDRLREAADYVLGAVQALGRAGADVGLIASNTPHIVFDEIAARSPIPLLSIVEATADAAFAMGARCLGLLGTRATMQGGFYQKAFAARGLAIALPGRADQALVHDRYMAELVPGDFREETRAAVLAVVERLVKEHAVQAVILGGTELPLLLRATHHAGVPLLDTTRIHVERAVSEILR
jgi:aspartate racemase